MFCLKIYSFCSHFNFTNFSSFFFIPPGRYARIFFFVDLEIPETLIPIHEHNPIHKRIYIIYYQLKTPRSANGMVDSWEYYSVH